MGKQQQTRSTSSTMREISRRRTLRAGWARVLSGSGQPGYDGVTPVAAAPTVEALIDELAADLRAGSYVPSPVRTVSRRQRGKDRVFGVPTVRDRIVQQSVRIVLQPALDGAQANASFAYVTGRGWTRACSRVRQLERRGYTHVFRFDIREFFDSVDHAVLQSQLADTMPSDVVALIMSLVRAPIVRANMLREVPKGLVLGTSLSPSLANHVLGPFDRSIQGVGPLVRYADDGVVAARSLQQATAAQERVAGALASLRLSINEQKSAVCSFQDGFEFLGVHFGGPDGVKATGAQR